MADNPRAMWFTKKLSALRQKRRLERAGRVACNLTGANAFFVQREHLAAFPEVPERWQRLYMPARYLPYPWSGHPPSLRPMQALLSN